MGASKLTCVRSKRTLTKRTTWVGKMGNGYIERSRQDLLNQIDFLIQHNKILVARNEKLRMGTTEWTGQPHYEPKTLREKMGYLVEEAGEVLAAAGKSLRWGLEATNPELPENEQEPNAAWLLRELVDLERAIAYVRNELEQRGW